jgi:hypothetical protein
MTTQTLQNDSLLRRALLGNTLFSGLSGLIAALAAVPLATFIGLPSPIILIVLGLGLMGYAALLYRMATRQPLSRNAALFAVAADIAWVAGSILLLLLGWPPFTTAGKWLVAILADIVAVFAVVQFIGLRRLR